MTNADHLSARNDHEPGNAVNLVATPANTVSDGQSVGYALNWYVVRATLGRASSVAEELKNRNLQVYLPMRRVRETVTVDGVTDYAYREELLSRNLLFVRCTQTQMEDLVHYSGIKGFTPYYNHFEQNRFGRDLYLIVPDRQMENFMRIVQTDNDNVIVRLGEELRLTRGKRVLVADGQFAGVEGIVMRIAGQRRVVVQLQDLGFAATAFVPTAFLRDV